MIGYVIGGILGWIILVAIMPKKK